MSDLLEISIAATKRGLTNIITDGKVKLMVPLNPSEGTYAFMWIDSLEALNLINFEPEF